MGERSLDLNQNRVEALAGLALAGVLLIGAGGLAMTVIFLLSTQWLAAGLTLIAAAIPFSVLFYVLYK